MKVRTTVILLLLMLLMSTISAAVSAQDEDLSRTCHLEAEESSYEATGDEFVAGISVTMYGNNPFFGQETMDLLFPRIDGHNFNAITIVFPIFQDSITSTDVYIDPAESPTIDHFRLLIRTAHEHGYTVNLKPMIEEVRLGNRWRGELQPGGDLSNIPALEAWFTSYADVIAQYAMLAEEEGVEYFTVGSELVSLDKDMPKYNRCWGHVVARVREVFSGLVVYNINYNPGLNPGFADVLDILSISAFYDLETADGDPSIEEIVQAFRFWTNPGGRIASNLALTRSNGTEVPIYFAEVGLAAMTGATYQPWNMQPREGDFNPDLQARYYQAACQVIEDLGLDGIYWWKVNVYQGVNEDLSRELFTPYDKPAEQVMSECNAHLREALTQ